MSCLRFLRASGIVLVMIVVLSACNFGSGGGVYLLPSRDMSIRASGISDSWYNGFEWSTLDYAFTTDLNPRLSRGSCSAEFHRFCAFQVNAGNSGWAGRYICRGPVRGSHPNATCRHAHIQLNSYYENIVSKVAVACHELGHGVGLHHRGTNDGSTCMNAQISRSTSGALGDHERQHINRHY